MDSKRTLGRAATAALALLLVAGLATAQAPQSTPLGTGFTYQGRLKVSGAPYSGTCDMILALYDVPNDGIALGTLPKSGVPVDEGLFTVMLDYGLAAFDGNARWLDIQVRCPAGGGTYQPLTPRQQLTASPYALYAARAANTWSLAGNAGTVAGKNYLGTNDNQALEIKVNATRALRLEPNATSPNVLGGYHGNWLTPDVYAAAIGGGGLSDLLNRVTDSAGTVAGGANNQAGDNAGSAADKPAATVGGGSSNTASGAASTVAGGLSNSAGGSSTAVGGGHYNSAGGDYAAVAGGFDNSASGAFGAIAGGNSNLVEGENAFAGGGKDNIARGNFATVAGGTYNIATGTAATIAGGNDGHATAIASTVGGGSANYVSSDYGTISGGYNHTTAGDYAAVGGGRSNYASGDFSTIPGGYWAKTTHYGQMAHASGAFASAGDAQASQYVMRRETSDAIWHDLWLDGSSALLTLSGHRTVTFDIQIAASGSAGESAGYRCWGVVELVDTILNPLGSSCWTHGEDDAAWDVRLGVDQTKDALLVQVLGNGELIRWVAVVRTAEVSY